MKVEVPRYDPEAVTWYRRFMGKAVKYRDLSRDMSEPESVRIRRREMMHFYARLAMTTCSGVRGSVLR